MAIIQNIFLGSCFLDFLLGLSLHSDKLGTPAREHWGCCPPHGGPDPRPRAEPSIPWRARPLTMAELSTPWLYPPGRAPLRGPSVSSAGIEPAPNPIPPIPPRGTLDLSRVHSDTKGLGLGSVCAAVRVVVSSLTTTTQRSRHSPSHRAPPTTESRVEAPGLLRSCSFQGRHRPSVQIPGQCAPPGPALAKQEAGRGPLPSPPPHQVPWHQVGMSPLRAPPPPFSERSSRPQNQENQDLPKCSPRDQDRQPGLAGPTAAHPRRILRQRFRPRE